MGEGGEGLYFKLFHEDVGYEGANWGNLGFPWFQLFALELLDKVLSVFEVVWGLAYNGFADMGELLGNPICD